MVKVSTVVKNGEKGENGGSIGATLEEALELSLEEALDLPLEEPWSFPWGKPWSLGPLLGISLGHFHEGSLGTFCKLFVSFFEVKVIFNFLKAFLAL